jgi:tetratricopeptide (TPR) repeat protein
MNDPTTPRSGAPSAPGWQILALAAVLACAVAAAFARGLRGPFLYDDVDSIAGNESIRRLATAFSPPFGATVSGRPVLNASFALNYLVSGSATWSYHALNIAIHVAAALALFGVLRRTLGTAAAGGRGGGDGLLISFGAALLWAVHPLQVESVTYAVQRAESLMGLFYLLTLYAFIRRAAGGRGAWAWGVASVGACLLGMGTKEVMATAPFVVLLYDWTFLGGSLAQCLRRARALYAAYAACWIPLAFLVARAGGRGGSAGFGSAVPWWAYLLTQFTAIAHYLRLCVWPRPLVGDYGRILAGDPLEVVLCAAIVLSLVAAAVALVRRRSPFGFLAAWFLVILAPSSSVIPVSTEIMAEHRMYLPLAAVATLGALALAAVLGRKLFPVAVFAAAAALAILSARRIRAYDSAFAFWSDVARKVPANAGAWNNLGIILAGRGDQKGAIEDYLRALSIAPNYAYAHYNLGNSLKATGHPAEAVQQYEKALLFQPADPSIHYNMANALALEKRWYAAAAEYREALRLDPGRMDAMFNLGDAMVSVGNLKEAAAAYGAVVGRRPDFADARVNYGSVLAEQGRLAEAVLQFREALKIDPMAADVHNDLGSVLAEGGRWGEARAEFDEALRLRPDYAQARDNLRRIDALEQAHTRP